MLISRQLKPQIVREEDWGRILQLLTRARRVHRHLDWQTPEAWIGRRPFYLALDNRRAAGVFAAPPDPPDTAWIRLLAADDDVPVGDVLRAVWPLARRDLEAEHVRLVCALALDEWVETALRRLDFRKITEVIVLARARGAPAASCVKSGFILRSLQPADLPAVAEVDRAAFDPPWRISERALRFALDEAALAAAAVWAGTGRIIGYQISTASPHGGHLARLAVLPEYQGRGVATALVADALVHLDRAGADYVTVNTQHDNYASLAVYRRFGFEPTGERLSVWALRLRERI